MDKRSRIELEKLENIAEEFKKKITSVPPPTFELFVTIFSISVAVMFFVYPEMLYMKDNILSPVYKNMTSVMPQSYWAISFFVACMLKALGLLFNYNWMRTLGLVFSTVLYAILSVCYILDFPSIGSIVFTDMTLFSALSIAFVKRTTIRNRKGDK